MKILHAPENIANQAWLMAEGLRHHGHEVQVWEYGESRFGYPADRVIVPGDDPAVYFSTLVEAVAEDFDVVHFHFARSLIPANDFLPWFWDLPVWRALGVKIVFTFHGSDVRLRSHHIQDDQWSFYRYADIPCDEELIASRLSVIRRYAHHMTVGSVLDRPYVPEARYVPKTVDVGRLESTPFQNRQRPVVVHAPSRRATKGSDFVLQGLDDARARGADFELDLVEGVSHEEAMTRMARADIVVEKLLGGDAGVTSLEAMAMGKVAIARIRDEVLDAHPEMPVVDADPETFTDVLIDLIADPEKRRRLGEQGREYVKKEHDVPVTGSRLQAMYLEPGRTGIPAFPDWPMTVPQKRAEWWRARMEKSELDRASLIELIDKLRANQRRLDQQMTALRAVAERPAGKSDDSSTPPTPELDLTG